MWCAISDFISKVPAEARGTEEWALLRRLFLAMGGSEVLNVPGDGLSRTASTTNAAGSSNAEWLTLAQANKDSDLFSSI